MIRPTPIESLLHRLGLLPTPVMDAFGGVLFGHALALGVRTGLFEELARSEADPAELADRTGMNPAALGLLLDAYESGGYLRRRGTRYTPSTAARRWLLRDSPESLVHLVLYFETLHRRWGDLEYAVRHGAPHHPYYESFADEDWKLYVYAMRDLAGLILPHVRKRLDLGNQPRLLLDVGGSHGVYAATLCQRYPSLEATVIDFPGALRHARSLLAAEPAGHRVRVLEGDFMDLQFPGGQDGVLLFNVIHGLSEDANRRLVRKSLAALREGGRLYVLDQFRGARGTSGIARFLPLMVGLNLLNESGGGSYAPEEVRGWCGDVQGFRMSPLRLPGVVLLEVTA